MDVSSKPAAVIATARAGGSIAAVRSLGRDHIPVTVLASHRVAAASASRFATSVHAMSPETDERFIDDLCALGQASPGQVLLPTSDQTAWLYSRHADRLGEFFKTYQPGADVIERILDKASLADIARRAGVPTLQTWAPASPEEVADLAPTLAFPILIKPRSHINRASNGKGHLTHSPDELIQAYARIIRSEHEAQSHRGLPAVQPPVLQRFMPMGREGVYSVSGFIDKSGELFVTRVSSKVFLRRYPAGVGVCYEGRPASEALSQAAWRLCRTAGFYGVFEIELMRCGSEWAVIDFNPRLFSQVGLDIARGMPLPNLLWLAAMNDLKGLKRAVQAARIAEDAMSPSILYDRFTLDAMLMVTALTLRAPRSERTYWRQWRRTRAADAVDYAWDGHDRWPGVVHVCCELWLGLKALPSFLRSFVPTLSASPLIAEPQ